MSTQGYNIYKIQYNLGLQDPAFTETRYHTVVFVETDANGGGYIRNVIGDMVAQSGMTYQSKRADPPEQLDTFH
jgi:hypothetical protein